MCVWVYLSIHILVYQLQLLNIMHMHMYKDSSSLKESLSTSCSVRVLDSSPLAAELSLHPPDNQSDVHLPAAAVIATWSPTHCFSEKEHI